MLDFLMNNREYELQSDNQLASILVQFDSDYAMNVVEDTLTQMFNRFDTLPKPNIVKAFKQTFQQLYTAYPYDQEAISAKEKEMYRDTISAVSKKYGFQFIENEDTDLYLAAMFIYDFFVSNFNNYLVSFFSRFLYEERDNIYSTFNLEQLKLNKDMSSNYGKAIFGQDNALLVITSNLPLVLSYIKNMEIPDTTVYGYAYGMVDTNIINIFSSQVTNGVPLFVLYNQLINNPILRGDIITLVRLKMQQDYFEALDPKIAANMTK